MTPTQAQIGTAKWPDPTPEMLASPQFEAIWQCIKRWDINVPDVYNGYCGANGNHVRAILDALAAAAGVGKQKVVFQSMPDGSTAVLETVQPTQAQIEAAAKAVEEAYKCYGTEFTTIAICALAAAAEVGPTEIEALEEHQAMLQTHAEIEAATIERCARVAEWFSDVEKFTAEDVAARIRALKDKP